MKIRELLDGGRVTLSFEVFPPKADADFEPIREAVGAISALRPAHRSSHSCRALSSTAERSGGGGASLHSTLRERMVGSSMALFAAQKRNAA